MNIEIAILDGKPVICVEGNLTIDSVTAAKQQIVAAVVDAGTAQLDLSAVRECDTAGVQLILMTRMDARARGFAFSALNRSPSFQTLAERIGVPNSIFEYSKSPE